MNPPLPLSTGPRVGLGELLRCCGPVVNDLSTWPLPAGRVLQTHLARVGIEFVCRFWGLGAGDEVLVPAYHCGSEVDALVAAGLHVRLYRVDEHAQADWDDCRSRVTARTKLVYAIHYFGWPQPLTAMKAWCAERGLRLLEDCALALFSRAGRGPIGGCGDAAVFSLPKTLPVPDGGLLVLRRDDRGVSTRLGPASLRRTTRRMLPLVKNALLRRSAGLRRAYTALRPATTERVANEACSAAYPDMPATYYFDPRLRDRGMSALAARLAAQCRPADVVERRRENYSRLVRQLPADAGIRPLWPELPEGVCPLVLPLIVKERNEWCRGLWQRGAAAVPWWAGYHRSLDWSEFPEAVHLKNNLLTLPIHHQLDSADIDAIADVVHESLNRRSHPENANRPATGVAPIAEPSTT